MKIPRAKPAASSADMLPKGSDIIIAYLGRTGIEIDRKIAERHGIKSGSQLTDKQFNDIFGD